jgi:hypothetical protein
MPRPRYQMTDADVAVVRRWVRAKCRETTWEQCLQDNPTTEQLQQWCDRFLEAAQWKQLHAVIRAARRDASQTRTVRLSTRASTLLHDLAKREQLTLSETIERSLTAVIITPPHQDTSRTAEQPPVQQAVPRRMGAPKTARAAVAPQKRRRAFVTTKKGVCYLTVKIGRENCHLMRIYNYTIDAQKKRDMRRRHPDVAFDWQTITRQLAEKREVCRRYRARRRTARVPRVREPFYGVIDPVERTVYVNDPTNIAGMGALLDAIIAGGP